MLRLRSFRDAEQPPSEAVAVAPAEMVADELGPVPKAPKRRRLTVRGLSRWFGAIPDSAVVGRASVIIWPLGRIHWL